jgi:hypothetical protein
VGHRRAPLTGVAVQRGVRAAGERARAHRQDPDIIHQLTSRTEKRQCP